MNWEEFRSAMVVVLMFCFWAGIGAAVSLNLAECASQNAWHHFDADRACRPGMMVEKLTGSRALCIGGSGETWVVEVEK